MAKTNSYDNVYLTTCIVPVYSAYGLVIDTHHSHFSIGPRVENGIRDIVFDCHPVMACRGRHIHRAQRVRLEDIVTLGFEIDTITDWTDEEAAILSGIFCPKPKSLYDEEQRVLEEAAPRWHTQPWQADEEQPQADEEQPQLDDDESEQGYASE